MNLDKFGKCFDFMLLLMTIRSTFSLKLYDNLENLIQPKEAFYALSYTYKIPTMIINNRPFQYTLIAKIACDQMRLSPRERKLFLYFVSCKTGFRPALKQIQKETGISSNKVSEIRSKLHNKCLVKYNRDRRTIKILWKAVEHYSLGKFPRNGHGHYTPDDYDYYLTMIKDLPNQYKVRKYHPSLKKDEIRFLEYLETLTAYEYGETLAIFPENKELSREQFSLAEIDDRIALEKSILLDMYSEENDWVSETPKVEQKIDPEIISECTHKNNNNVMNQ